MTADNWVERRAAREQRIKSEGPELWNALRATLQDACESYRDNFAKDGREIDWKLENGRRIRITRRVIKPGSSPIAVDEVLVAYQSDSHIIEVTRKHGTSQFPIRSNDHEAYIGDSRESELDPDELSQKILEPLLFPQT